MVIEINEDIKREAATADLYRNAMADLQQWGDRRVEMSWEISAFLVTVGMIQLACRHERVAQPMKIKVGSVIFQQEEKFRRAGYSGIADMIQAGWHPQYDQKE